MNAPLYPDSKKTADIRDKLQEFEPDVVPWSRDVPKFLRHFSSAIRFAARSTTVSSYVLRDWIWIGSQLRIHAGTNRDVLAVAGRLILYVFKQFEGLRGGDEEAQANIRWATAYTVSILLDELGADGFRTFMSGDERRLAEDQWLKIYEVGRMNLADIDEDIQGYLRSFDDVASECYLPDLSNKIRELRNVASGDTEESLWAAAALAYLVVNKDIIPDNLGYFGLVDDIFVLNQAFAMCCRQSPWLFLLDSFVSEWADLARVVVSDQGDFSALPQYVQAVLGSVLFSLTHGPRSTCVAIPQSGSVAHFAAFFAALVAARKNAVADPLSQDIQAGDDIVLVSANRTVKARYKGTTDQDGQTFHMVELASGSRAVGEEFLDAMHAAAAPHRTLSTSNEFQKWHDDFSPILLEQLLRTKLRLDELVPEVLLITGRNRLEHWLQTFHPMGKKVSELLGVRYFMRSGLWEDIAGTIGTKPLLVVCNDTFTATELLRSNDEAKACENLRWVIVDVSGITGDLMELVLALQDNEALRCVFVTGLEEAEICRELHEGGAEQIYVAPDDVGVLGPRSANSKSSDSTNVYMTQIRTQSVKETNIIEIDEESIRDFYELALTIRSAAKELDNAAFEILSYTLRQLIRKIARLYYPLDDDEKEEFASLIDSSIRLANMVKAYHPDIPSIICRLSALADSRQNLQKKYEGIVGILARTGLEGTALFCPSKTQVEHLSGRCVELFGVSPDSLVTIQDLRKRSPYENLVIPGWFDKKQMRELRVSGFAQNFFMVLYPFEHEWERVSSKAQRRWSNQLLGATSAYAKRFAQTYDDFSSVERWPKAMPIVTKEDAQEEGVSDWPNKDVIAALTRIRVKAEGQVDTVKARMVMFDDPEYFALLSPGGKVICIPEMLGETEESAGLSETSAESLLNRPVAELKPGSILAFPTSSAGDLLDSLADEILENSPNVRRMAGLWRSTLREYMIKNKIDPSSLNQKLRHIGVERHIATLRHWLFTDETIAPRSWRREIPLIGKLTGSTDITSNFKRVAEAIERIYQARREAADHLLEQLRTGEIDLERGLLTATIRDKKLDFRVLRIARIESQADVAAELVGKLHSMADLNSMVE